MTIDPNTLLIGAGVSLIGFLFQFYFKKIAKSLESIGQIHKDLDEIRATMDKLILFREEFLLMKNELEKAVNAINSIKEIEHKISLIDQSQKTQWARYDTLKVSMKRVTLRSREREHFFMNKLHIIRAILEEVIENDPTFKAKFQFEFAKTVWTLPLEMNGKTDEFE
jgi:predicted nuclease with TOPRIM domain